MKIAYVLYPGACYVGKGDGIKMQATIWRNALLAKGHLVEMVNPWEHYNWQEFDIVHVFGFGLWNYEFIHWGSKINPNFVFSPIIDSNTPIWKYRLATYAGLKSLRLYSQNYILRLLKKDIKLFFARSGYEANYLQKGYGIDTNKISTIPLSYRFTNYTATPKEDFCLFVGTMTQQRKNAVALIQAAIKYKFRLVLVGNTGNAESHNKLKQLVADHSNIEIKGFVSEDKLISLYNRSKVFALPSLNEGVGLVALEAAVHGCNIVITELGGPKEYYDDLAYLVNPYDIDSIGKSIIKALADDNIQPKLREHIIQKYAPEVCIKQLIAAYENVISK